MNRLPWRVGAAALMACVALSSGCATITGSETQTIMVATNDDTGNSVAGAECKLSNNNGSWTLKSPGTASVRKSADDLLVRCEMEDHTPGTARVVSKVNAGMFGNVIFGGGVGAIIDHTRGTAYDYPTQVRIVFGTNRVVESDDTITTTVASPAAPPPAPQPQGQTTLQELDGLLKK